MKINNIKWRNDENHMKMAKERRKKAIEMKKISNGENINQ